MAKEVTKVGLYLRGVGELYSDELINVLPDIFDNKFD